MNHEQLRNWAEEMERSDLRIRAVDLLARMCCYLRDDLLKANVGFNRAGQSAPAKPEPGMPL